MSTPTNEELEQNDQTSKIVLIVSIFIAGLCSIIYELLVSTTSAYFLGDSVKQFSITIGVYMAAMGLGSYFSRFFQGDLLAKFIGVEILLGLIGGISVPILYFVFAHFDLWSFQMMMVFLIIVIGVLTGLEIPLLTRIMKNYYPLKINLSNVLALDYFGALLATLLFPFFLLPFLGTFKSSVLFGMLNIALGFINLWYFSEHLQLSRKRVLGAAILFISVFFTGLLWFSNNLMSNWNNELYRDQIIYSEQTPYQNIVLTKGQEDVRLYINRIIQFSSMDEHRYHESMVHIPMSLAPNVERVLILGGGEGLIAREVLKHKQIEAITVVDLDPAIFKLATENPLIKGINQGSIENPRVNPVAMDAFVYLQENAQLYDLIISDLPEPTDESLARLYSREFFKLAKKRLSATGVFVTQASGTFHSTNAFWCIEASAKAGGFEHTYPYHAYVPSFGDWGFIMASKFAMNLEDFEINVPTKFLSDDMIPRLFYFEKDLLRDTILPSSLDQPNVLHYYLEDYARWRKLVK